MAIVEEFYDYIRGVRVVYHFTDYARVTLGQHLNQQVRVYLYLLCRHPTDVMPWCSEKRLMMWN